MAHSSAMGWLTDPSATRPGGLWGMNDAGWTTPGAGPTSAWFQVTLGGEPAARRPLPTQPFLEAAAGTISRIAEWQLGAAQLLLPVHLLDGDGLPARVGTLLQDAGWLRAAETRSRRHIDVVLEFGGESGGAEPLSAHWLLDWIGRLDQRVATGLAPGTDTPHPDLGRPADHLWGGPPHHRSALTASLPEFGPVAIGWWAALLAEACAAAGVRNPVLVTLSAGDAR